MVHHFIRREVVFLQVFDQDVDSAVIHSSTQEWFWQADNAKAMLERPQFSKLSQFTLSWFGYAKCKLFDVLKAGAREVQRVPPNSALLKNAYFFITAIIEIVECICWN